MNCNGSYKKIFKTYREGENKMKDERFDKEYMCNQINGLKARCKELSQENLLLKHEIADLRLTNVLLGGA